MMKLKKLLSDELKVIRHRRLVLGIQITITAWLVELIASFGGILVAIVGGIDTSHVEELISIVYAVVLPGIVVIRDSELKENILTSSWYVNTLDKLGLTYKGPKRNDGPNNEPQPPVVMAITNEGAKNVNTSEGSPREVETDSSPPRHSRQLENPNTEIQQNMRTNVSMSQHLKNPSTNNFFQTN